MSDPVDYVGRLIKVGDLVAYPVRRRSRMELKSARVSVISRRDKDHTMMCYNEQGRRVTLLHTARMIVIGENDDPC